MRSGGQFPRRSGHRTGYREETPVQGLPSRSTCRRPRSVEPRQASGSAQIPFWHFANWSSSTGAQATARRLPRQTSALRQRPEPPPNSDQSTKAASCQLRGNPVGRFAKLGYSCQRPRSAYVLQTAPTRSLPSVSPNKPINRTRHGSPALGVISFSPSAGPPRRAGYRRR